MGLQRHGKEGECWYSVAPLPLPVDQLVCPWGRAGRGQTDLLASSRLSFSSGLFEVPPI